MVRATMVVAAGALVGSAHGMSRARGGRLHGPVENLRRAAVGLSRAAVAPDRAAEARRTAKAGRAAASAAHEVQLDGGGSIARGHDRRELDNLGLGGHVECASGVEANVLGSMGERDAVGEGCQRSRDGGESREGMHCRCGAVAKSECGGLLSIAGVLCVVEEALLSRVLRVSKMNVCRWTSHSDVFVVKE